jgi:phytoene/squalene synthetase
VKECYRFHALTSRSFVAVIQELHPELLMPICVFHLVLRGLDAIEDDMTMLTRGINKIKDEYKVIVKDITMQMGNRMTTC